MTKLMNLAYRVILGLVTCVIVLSIGILTGLIFAFFPFALLWAFANQHAENAEIAKAYRSLMKRYHDGELFES